MREAWTAPRTLEAFTRLFASRPGVRAMGIRGALALRWWTYDRLSQGVASARAALVAAGVAPGEPVLLRARGGPEWMAAFFALSSRGAVPVLVDADQDDAFCLRVAERAGARRILHDGNAPTGLEGLPMVPADAPDPGPVPTRPDTTAVIVFSSGTTGVPRGVPIVHERLLSGLARFARWRPLADLVRVRVLVTVPPSHVFGLLVGLLAPAWLGYPVVWLPDATPAGLLRAARDNRCAILVTVPALLSRLRGALLGARIDGRTVREQLEAAPAGEAGILRAARRRLLGRHLRLILVGGATLPDELERFWARCGLLVIQGYGSTEAGALVALSARWGRWGGGLRPLSRSVELRVEEGELLVRAPSVARDGVAERLTPDGFLRTGDLARFERGRLVLLGRKDDVIVPASGRNVYPEDVEAVVEQVVGVRECAVVPEVTGEGVIVHAVLVLAPGVVAADVVVAANRLLQPHQQVRAWSEARGPLPRTPLGKLRRVEIQPSHPPAVPTVAVARAELPTRLDRLTDVLLADRPPPPDLADARLGDDLALGSMDVVDLGARLADAGALLDPGTLEVSPGTTVSDLWIAVRSADRPVVPPRRRGPVTRGLAGLVRPVLHHGVGLALRARGTPVRACWHAPPSELPESVLLVAAGPAGVADPYAVALTLPPGRGRLLALSVCQGAYAHYTGPSLRARLFRIGAHLSFRVVVLAHEGAVRVALEAVGTALDERRPVLEYLVNDTAWGVGRVVAEAGATVVPVHLGGDRDGGFDRRDPSAPIVVHYGAPVCGSGPEMVRALREAHAELASCPGK